jgi:hypothetical protein
MSDGITDADTMTASRIEIWRQKTKEEFIHNLTTQELVDELCKREGVLEISTESDTSYCISTKGDLVAINSAKRILVLKE